MNKECLKKPEIYNKVKEFLKHYPKGVVHLVYPDLFNTGGIEITKHNIDNRIQFGNDGVMIKQTLGYSLVTGKHLYLPYGNCAFVFIEESSDGDVE